MPHRSLVQRTLVAWIPCLLALAPWASAQDADPVLDSLARAKAAYDAENSAVGASLLELFDARTKELLADQKSSAEKLAKATAKNDAERVSFEQAGVWPPSFQREELTRRRRSAREALVKAWQDAEQALAAAQKLDDAAALAADRAAFDIAKDLAPWRAAAPFFVDANDSRRWIPGADGWSSPTTDPTKQPPVPFTLRADAPEGALRYALAFDVQRLGEPCGLDLQFVDSEHRLVQHHVPTAELDAALASKVYGREQSAHFVLVVQDGYARLDAEGRPILRRTNGESAPDAVAATASDPWFGLVPQNGAKVRISAVNWKPFGSPEKGAEPATFRPKSRELAAAPTAPTASTTTAAPTTAETTSPPTAGSAEVPPQPAPTDSRPRMLRTRSRSPAVEDAILDGLRWLARHQDDDGSWTPTHAVRHCDADDPAYAPAEAYADEYDTAVTAMAVLAFLGTGIDATSKIELVDEARDGRYEVVRVVRKALSYLATQQRADGSFSRDGSPICVDALATRALCEAATVLQDPALAAQAQKALDFLQSAQARDSAGNVQGWSRSPRAGAAKDDAGSAAAESKRDPYDADTASTGWCATALRAGQIAGLHVDPAAIPGADSFARRVTETAEAQPTGVVAWFDVKATGAPNVRSLDTARSHQAAMSAVGALVRRFAGAETRDPFVVMAADRILRELPVVSEDYASVDYYYWHQGTLALNFVGGPDAPKRNTTYWVPWKKKVVDALISLQDRTGGSCAHGGWLTPDRWAYAHGGPMCATALNVLTLQMCE